MRVMITGSNGLLGQKLVNLLSQSDGIELLATSLGENRIQSQVGNYNYQELDITDLDSVMDTVARFRPEALINTAAMTQVDLCEDLKEKCRLINVGAVGYLIAACKRYNTHFVQLSTDFVFDGLNGPYSEEDEPNPLSYYANSKYDAEQLIINAGLDKWTIVRTIIIYGVAEQMSRSNIVLWAMDALQKGEQLKIVDDQFRAPTLAEDLALGCKEIVQRSSTGIYHLSGPEIFSILELVKRIAKHFGWSMEKVHAISSESLNQKAKRPPRTGFILDKAIRDLDYNPKKFEDGLDIIANQLIPSSKA